MKKVWKTVVGCILVYALSFGVTAAVMGIAPGEKEVVTADVGASAVNAEPEYMLKAQNGKVAVFVDGELTVMTDISVSGMREADRKLLEQGIVLGTYNDVLCMLEDFGS